MWDKKREFKKLSSDTCISKKYDSSQLYAINNFGATQTFSQRPFFYFFSDF